MIFSKKQTKKIDPKIRFQHQSFTKQVKEASDYKRKARAIPETGLAKFLASIGLDTWTRRGIVIAGILLLLYFVYVPNVFFIKHIEVTGVATSEVYSITQTVDAYVRTAQIFPQKNLVFLNTQTLTQKLGRHDAVLSVTSVQKKYPSTLIIELRPKLEVLTLDMPSGAYVLYNNGVVSRAIQKNEQGQLIDPKGVLVKAPYITTLEPGKQYMATSFIDTLSELRNSFRSVVGYDIAHIEVLPVQDEHIEQTSQTEEGFVRGEVLGLVPGKQIDPVEFLLVAKQPGNPDGYSFSIYLDSKLDVRERLDKVSLLLQQFPEEKRATIVYVDLRFKNKGFVCFKGSTCEAKPVSNEPVPATEEELKN